MEWIWAALIGGLCVMMFLIIVNAYGNDMERHGRKAAIACMLKTNDPNWCVTGGATP